MITERVRVGDVLTLQRREVIINPVEDYRLIGIYSFGKGIFHRSPRIGADLGDYRFFAVKPDDLVLSNIQAWEGAIGHATEVDAGTVGTHRFLTYVPIADRIDTNWARWFLLSEPGIALIRRAAPGSTMRNRTLSIDRFEALEIPLPPIDEQRRIATRLDNVRQHASAAIEAQLRARWFDKAVVDAAVWRIIERGIASGWPLRALGDIADINPRPHHLDPDESVSFVPMAALDQYTGSIESAELRNSETVGAGYKQFRRGDVIFARITPCMQNGKTAIFDGQTDWGYGSTEFHVIRPGSEVKAEWLHRFLRTQEFRNLAAQRLTGTAGQQRVSAGFLQTVSIPTPSESEQYKALLAINKLLDSRRALALSRTKASTLALAIEPAIINQAFADLA